MQRANIRNQVFYLSMRSLASISFTLRPDVVSFYAFRALLLLLLLYRAYCSAYKINKTSEEEEKNAVDKSIYLSRLRVGCVFVTCANAIASDQHF